MLKYHASGFSLITNSRDSSRVAILILTSILSVWYVFKKCGHWSFKAGAAKIWKEERMKINGLHKHSLLYSLVSNYFQNKPLVSLALTVLQWQKYVHWYIHDFFLCGILSSCSSVLVAELTVRTTKDARVGCLQPLVALIAYSFSTYLWHDSPFQIILKNLIYENYCDPFA